MKIVIGIATMQGREKYLEKTLLSLNNQGAIIEVYHNQKEKIDYTDNAKFVPLEKYKNETIYFLSCDDDIIYPRNYVKEVVKHIDKYKCIVTYHGRILKGKSLNYYRHHLVFQCTKKVERDTVIDVCGTGVTGFRTDYFNPIKIYKSPLHKMSDLVFSLSAAINKKKIVLLKHEERFIIAQDIPIKQTIHGTESNKCSVQNLVADKIYDIKKGV